MIIHLSETRGLADHGWLKSRHTFSFANYYNPERMGFGALRVINDDSVAPGMGFGTHPHRDMEIISIPLSGALEHKDSVGNSSVIKHGEVQIMSAGTGIAHSEYNASKTDAVKFLQIWVLPEKMGVTPRYEQKVFSAEERKNKLSMVVSPDGRQGSVMINQKAFFSLVDLDEKNEVTYGPQIKGQGVYVFILDGMVKVNGKDFSSRDGVGLTDVSEVKLHASTAAKILLMEVPL